MTDAVFMESARKRMRAIGASDVEASADYPTDIEGVKLVRVACRFRGGDYERSFARRRHDPESVTSRMMQMLLDAIDRLPADMDRRQQQG